MIVFDKTKQSTFGNVDQRIAIILEQLGLRPIFNCFLQSKIKRSIKSKNLILQLQIFLLCIQQRQINQYIRQDIIIQQKTNKKQSKEQEQSFGFLVKIGKFNKNAKTIMIFSVSVFCSNQLLLQTIWIPIIIFIFPNFLNLVNIPDFGTFKQQLGVQKDQLIKFNQNVEQKRNECIQDPTKKRMSNQKIVSKKQLQFYIILPYIWELILVYHMIEILDIY
ncbi:unnamed protein product [Paramecium sonneborni]|uniref:Transmembrane protein n=1 Tax=Paramecium sonneborni TaxID=65129 RepID=A0A8S1N4I9_9CILI|nr:unnamed protein product [Paramecium sonneborni]